MRLGCVVIRVAERSYTTGHRLAVRNVINRAKEYRRWGLTCPYLAIKSATFTDEYLQTLPKGSGMGEFEPAPDRDYGPALASQLGRDVGSALSIKLGDISIAYDLHTMDQAAIWSGGFLDVDQTQHKRGRGEGFPKPRGMAMENLSLWQWGHGDTLDYPKEDLLPRGPLPDKWLRYHRHYLHGDQIVLAYAIDDREILEVPSSIAGKQAVRRARDCERRTAWASFPATWRDQKQASHHNAKR